MVNVNTTIVHPGQGRRERMARIQKLNQRPGVRVEPAGGEGFTADDMRRLLKHPKAGGFRSEGDIEWPNDTFTHRRLKEGSIKLVKPPEKHDETAPPSHPPPRGRSSHDKPDNSAA